MAKGDRIGIADKATLDLVKAGVDSANQKLGSLAIGSNRDAYTATELLTKLKIGVLDTTVSTGFTRVLNETVGGKIYMMMMTVPPGTDSINTASMSIVVDNQTVFNRTTSTNSGSDYNKCLGIITPEANIRFIDGRLLVFNDNINFKYTVGLSAFSGASSESNWTINYSPKPIRFNSSINVNAYSTAAICNIYYMYELD